MDMNKREWKWTLGGLLGGLPIYLVTTVLATQVYDSLKFTPPEIYPSGPMTNLPLGAFVLLMNVVSEELWWRGYVLPRQEMQHGRNTWAVHGVLWAFFHAFKWWAVPFMLFTTWIIPFIAQRTGSTTPGFIIHLVTNGLGMLRSYVLCGEAPHPLLGRAKRALNQFDCPLRNYEASISL
jgi:membrane protease YdiL (CAAX protease family)